MIFSKFIWQRRGHLVCWYEYGKLTICWSFFLALYRKQQRVVNMVISDLLDVYLALDKNQWRAVGNMVHKDQRCAVVKTNSK
jgi:hypothetical protein